MPQDTGFFTRARTEPGYDLREADGGLIAAVDGGDTAGRPFRDHILDIQVERTGDKAERRLVLQAFCLQNFSEGFKKTGIFHNPSRRIGAALHL